MQNSPTRLPVSVVAYCATCDKERGESTEEHLGKYFQCPDATPAQLPHFAAVVKGTAGKFWLRVGKRLRSWEFHGSPFRWFSGWSAGAYLVVRLGVLIGCLSAASLLTKTWCVTSLTCLVSTVLIVDVLLSNTSVAFISRFPADPVRTAVLAVLSFLTLAVGFSVFYACFPEDAFKDGPLVTGFDAVYFSLVTLATVGYGDISPALGHWGLQAVVVSEILVGMYFLVVVLSIFASWASGRPTAPTVNALDDLITNRRSVLKSEAK